MSNSQQRESALLEWPTWWNAPNVGGRTMDGYPLSWTDICGACNKPILHFRLKIRVDGTGQVRRDQRPRTRHDACPNKLTSKPDCHPDRKHRAKGLCQACYNQLPDVQAKKNEVAAAHKRENAQRIKAIKTASGCVICGYNESSYSLDFAHIDASQKYDNSKGNAFHISWPWPKIEAEIAKCRILCANCHRVETAKERGYGE